MHVFGYDAAAVNPIIGKAFNGMSVDLLAANQNRHGWRAADGGNSQNPADALMDRERLRNGKHRIPDG